MIKVPQKIRKPDPPAQQYVLQEAIKKAKQNLLPKSFCIISDEIIICET